ncbi:bifunctional methylenetetrahydrofolate dehydrogenase/methenyltetrahydrofolate cyclohydrolase FolD [Bacillus carboniphilus]|uniref:Bifunctional protein FolD n=1 Tax=Bacillus carboniphilus TaxID=86663 RepID=A0ABY9JYN6_9BACI|nr:bifunctional methylenetetrahydrofolate dehydrogenase/methenyltetrahydrofolate cyclohydrolase FolD [Bacillus carboniphilus]WLR43883.1 bifunctional methylenetetrahydrofolate dehydrogenase/methenyltetrahydrofolate cyclohydrolase FolD [Bacillus carboniphilus]
MSATIISGKDVAKDKRTQLKKKVEEIRSQGVVPKLIIILVGNDPASLSYIKGKKKAAEETGVDFTLEHLDEGTTEATLLQLIDRYNNDNMVDGILVQLPLPAHIDETKVIEKISPEKDVDGFHPINIGRMMTQQDCFLPCTPAGILELIKTSDINISGKNAVIIGRSNIVGKPVGQMLLNEHATVTYCHSRTKNIEEFTKQADIVVVAVGIANFLPGNAIKEGAIVIDVGVNRLESGKLCGDVHFEEASEHAGHITPVPGGVGPMTITMLISNTVKAAEKRARK